MHTAPAIRSRSRRSASGPIDSFDRSGTDKCWVCPELARLLVLPLPLFFDLGLAMCWDSLCYAQIIEDSCFMGSTRNSGHMGPAYGTKNHCHEHRRLGFRLSRTCRPGLHIGFGPTANNWPWCANSMVSGGFRMQRKCSILPVSGADRAFQSSLTRRMGHARMAIVPILPEGNERVLVLRARGRFGGYGVDRVSSGEASIGQGVRHA